MNKIFTLTLALAALCCTTLSAKQRTETQLQQLALQKLGLSASTVKGKYSTKSATKVSLTKHLAEKQLSVYGAEGQGFVVLSNDDHFPAVLGYSSDEFDQANLPCGLQWWIGAMESSLETLAESGADVSAIPSYAPAKTIGPLLKTTWSQDEPFNRQCPQYMNNKDSLCLTGCIATSLSQILYHHKWPAQATGSGIYSYYYKADGDTAFQLKRNNTRTFNTKYDWDNMLPAYVKEDAAAGTQKNYNDTHADAVAALMADVGAAIGMKYGKDISGAGVESAAGVLAHNFGFDSLSIAYVMRDYYTDDEWGNILREELEANRPIDYNGLNRKSPNWNDFYNDGVDGHSFVVDGMNTEGLLHVNWGWEGRKDNWFNLNLLCPDTVRNYIGKIQVIVGLEGRATQPVTESYCPKFLSAVHLPQGMIAQLQEDGQTIQFNYNLKNCGWRAFRGNIDAVFSKDDNIVATHTLMSINDQNEDSPRIDPFTWLSSSSTLNLKDASLNNLTEGTYKLNLMTKCDIEHARYEYVRTRFYGVQTLLLTVKGTGDSRTFSLTKQTSDIKDVLTDATAKETTATQYFDLSGRRLSSPQQGVNIVKKDGKTYKVQINRN